MRSNEASEPPEERDFGHVEPEAESADGLAPGCAGNELAEVPANLPARVLSADALARHGLSELAKRQMHVETLPSFREPIGAHCVVSDEANERVLLLGGWSNVGLWAFDFVQRSWRQLKTGRFQPDAVGHPSVVFDAKRRRLIWFGGWPPGLDAPVDDLYSLDVSGSLPWEWQYIEHQHPWPLPRNGASLILDAKRDRCVLFGGDAGPGTSFSPLNDLWTLDLETLTWKQWKGTFWKRGPSKRWLHSAVYDANGDRMIMFGGAGRWKWDTAFSFLDLESMEWKQMAASGDPLPKMEGQVMVHAPEAKAVFIYGGLMLEGPGPSSMPYLWRCDLDTMRASRVDLPPDMQPSGRFCHAGCYCRHRRALFCVGGKWNREVGNYYVTDGEFADAFLIHLD